MRDGRQRVEADHVHIWSLRLDLSLDALRQLEAVLSAEERSRAERFVVACHRWRYVAAHGLLRTLLSDYLGTEPTHVTLEKHRAAKPRLPHPPQRLRFNLTHSGGLALVALSADREVGIDLEEIREIRDLWALAQTCLSPAEQAALAALPGAQRVRAFFAGWTRKEVYVKLLGEGILRPLHSFDATIAPGEPARLLRVQDAPGAPSGYTLRALEPAPGYVGALAVDAPSVRVRRRGWKAPSALSKDTGGSGEDRRCPRLRIHLADLFGGTHSWALEKSQRASLLAMRPGKGRAPTLPAGLAMHPFLRQSPGGSHPSSRLFGVGFPLSGRASRLEPHAGCLIPNTPRGCRFRSA